MTAPAGDGASGGVTSVVRVVVHVCTRCGNRATAPGDGMPPAWSLGVERDERVLLCDRCTRAHVRDIEAKLDQEWWT